MKRYQQYTFSTTDAQQSEIISGLLSQHAFAGVEERDGSVVVFFEEAEGNTEVMQEIAVQTGSQVQLAFVDDQNWNSLWESNFEPVTVNDFVSIRADFHPPATGMEHEIVITPKMSFGTGHHATTWSMVNFMRGIDFSGCSVFDFGTGTGILAILASMLGAKEVHAIDNDEWSIENARENFLRNKSVNITLSLAKDASGNALYDVILANINKNVILANLSSLDLQLAPGGTLLVSGLLEGDEPDIVKAASLHGLIVKDKMIRDKWLCLKFSRA